MSCGCQEINSPVPGILWAADTEEVQRCDTHEPEPIYASDDAAADALRGLGWDVRQDANGGRWFAHPPAEKPTVAKVLADDLKRVRDEMMALNNAVEQDDVFPGPWDEAIWASGNLLDAAEQLRDRISREYNRREEADEQ